MAQKGVGTEEGYLDRNAKLVPSDPDTMALTSAAWVAGHHTVFDTTALYSIKAFTLSPSTYGTYISGGEDAVGQLWYVQNENAFYQLIDWSKRGSADGWAKTNLKASVNPSGTPVSQTTGTNIGWLTGITITGDGTLSNTNASLAKKGISSSSSYTSGLSQYTIPVVTSIDIDTDGRTIDYNTCTYTLLSQSHHGGSKEGNFLTKVSLSNTGALSGEAGTFTNEYNNGTWNYNNAQTYLQPNSGVIAYTYIDTTGKLKNTYAKVPEIVSNIEYKQEANTVITYLTKPNGGNITTTKYSSSESIGKQSPALPIVSYNGPGIMMPISYSNLNTAYDYIENTARNWILDIDNRLEGKNKYKTVGSMTTSVTWTRYKPDGTTKYDSTPSKNKSITVTIGDWVEATYYVTWSRTSSSATVNSSSGTWGSSAISTDPNSTGGTLSTKTITKTQLTSDGSSVKTGQQSIKWYIGNSVSSLVVENNVVRKKNGEAKYSNSSSTVYSATAAHETCRWYGVTSLNIASATSSEIQNILSSLTSDKSWSKGLTSTFTTSSSKKYFIYIWPQSAGKITQASTPGADATGWFNIKDIKTISIPQSNGYALNYYYIYALNENAFSASPKLTFA